MEKSCSGLFLVWASWRRRPRIRFTRLTRRFATLRTTGWWVPPCSECQGRGPLDFLSRCERDLVQTKFPSQIGVEETPSAVENARFVLMQRASLLGLVGEAATWMPGKLKLWGRWRSW